MILWFYMHHCEDACRTNVSVVSDTSHRSTAILTGASIAGQGQPLNRSLNSVDALQAFQGSTEHDALRYKPEPCRSLLINLPKLFDAKHMHVNRYNPHPPGLIETFQGSGEHNAAQIQMTISPQPDNNLTKAVCCRARGCQKSPNHSCQTYRTVHRHILGP